jgi:hypothetical protein
MITFFYNTQGVPPLHNLNQWNVIFSQQPETPHPSFPTTSNSSLQLPCRIDKLDSPQSRK